MINKEINSTKIQYQIGLLIFGTMLTILGLNHVFIIWTPKSKLVQIKGTLSTVNTYVNTITDRRGHSSQASELIFFINENQQKYRLAENIDDKYYNEGFEKILQELKKAETVSIWIKKSEIDNYQPKIFQITVDHKTILDFETIKKENRSIGAFTLLLGLATILFSLWTLFPDKINKILF